jgi:DNA-binding PadR family transcriptional regulator
LALAILTLLAEAPSHPYEMRQKMHERHHDRAIPLKSASIYDTVERLAQQGLIEPVETTREGRRPERTVYRITPAGTDEMETWVREMVEKPSPEYPRFGAALMFIAALRHKAEVINLLEYRAAAFDIQIAAGDALLRAMPPDLARLFAIEEEYAQAMRRAEMQWLRKTIAELKDGTLEWPAILEAEWPIA